MEIEFRSNKLDRLETDIEFDGGVPREVVKAYRKRLQSMRAACDERELRVPRANHFERLKGDRSHEHSIRLNKQWRLILEILKRPTGKVIRIVDIEDYH